jgi:hypothetical protein
MPATDQYTFVSDDEMGDPIEPDCPVPMEIWRRCLDPVIRSRAGCDAALRLHRGERLHAGR